MRKKYILCIDKKINSCRRQNNHKHINPKQERPQIYEANTDRVKERN